MAAILRVMGFSLLLQGCLSSVGHVSTGCMKLTQDGNNFCCDACRPGNRLVKRCGPTPGDLCTPCESGTFTADPGLKYSCNTCTQCAGAQVYAKVCTPTKDTQCGCKQGLMCGDGSCSFCIKKCEKGEEPTEDRYCRPCPNGTFNAHSHQKCKPWNTKCPHPAQYVKTEGTSISDIMCANVSIGYMQKPSPPGTTEQTWPLVISVLTSLALTSFIVILILTVTMKHVQKRKKAQIAAPNTLIIRTPTDHPMPLRAVECSFHEAEQEQGGSSESLETKDSSDQLLP